ncbi:MAG TPA: NAD-dependent epimerase/dehydratase family protein [Kofleriaceae bacterium]|nr:NAD-dependent epimerase/dehydratase family protein [Kofleriaceae bacterium]
MKILLTGAGGQIGHDLIGALVAQGHDVISTDLAPRPPSHAHAEGVDWQRLDVTDAAAVQHTFTEVRPDLVFHLAAILSATGEANPRLAYDVNQTGTWNVLEACRRAKVGRLIFTSSIAVFGPPPSGPLPDPCPDDVALHPTTMYGVTKVSGELLCAYYRSRYGIDCRGVRFPGLISAAMPGGGSSDYALFMYVDAVRKGGYEAFARADTRIPLMYMPDGVRALLELAFADKSKLSRTMYNIAAFSPRADEIATSVRRAIPDAKFTYAPDTVRQGILDSWPKSIDDAAARRDWGWKHKFDLDAMTDDLLPRVRRMLDLGAVLSH